MPLINATRVLNNIIVLGVLAAIGFMIYLKLDKERVKSTIESIKGWFGSKEE